MNDRYFVCPCCGFDRLDVLPYLNICTAGVFDAKPPYRKFFGAPSYDVCSCCGFEFGFDDNPEGDLPGSSFGDYLYEWISQGMIWFDPKEKPPNFDLATQLDRIGKTYFIKKINS